MRHRFSRRGRRQIGVLAAACLAVVMSACGSGTSAPTPVATSPQPTPAAPVSTPAPATTALPATSSAEWPTYHADLTRTGVAPGGSWTALSLTWQSDQLDGQVYAEPLVAGGQVVVATENDSVYALDATSGNVRWHAHLGEPMAGSSLPCGNIDPSGITGTPVVDAEAGVVYAVAFVRPGQHQLFALDLGSGNVRFSRPIDAPGADPLVHQQRAGLTLANGRVYVAFGGLFGDCGDYHGRIVAVNADGSGDLLSYQVAAGERGAIWAPPGPSVDASGALYVATGNSNATDSPDDGDSVIRLSPDLQRLDSFTPRGWAQDNARDQDLGSMSPALLDGGLVFQAGKTGTGYLLRASALGGIGGEVVSRNICSGAYGGAAYHASVLYVPCRDGLVAVRVDAITPDFSVAWRGPRFDAGPPIIAGGLTWTLDLGSGDLYGLNPSDGTVVVRESVGQPVHFATPASDGVRLYVGAGRKIVAFEGK